MTSISVGQSLYTLVWKIFKERSVPEDWISVLTVPMYKKIDKTGCVTEESYHFAHHTEFSSFNCTRDLLHIYGTENWRL